MADFPKHELFALASQMKRASVSIPSKIRGGATREVLKNTYAFYVFL